MSLTPITRREHFMARAAGDETALELTPVTREEHFLKDIADNQSGGGEVTPASIVTATSQMTEQQQADTRDNLDAPSKANLSAVTAALANCEQKPTTVTVSGTTPTITPAANTTYNCGELTSLTISNPPATGKYSIVFFSGATPTTTVGIENFVAEANKRYKITVEDNYATYDSWPYTPT